MGHLPKGGMPVSITAHILTGGKNYFIFMCFSLISLPIQITLNLYVFKTVKVVLYFNLHICNFIVLSKLNLGQNLLVEKQAINNSNCLLDVQTNLHK